ncbi:pyrroloquinoline quinone biosynthesis peptide chaperone PqqD [Spelaeicoccus albus]|nr:pyrroloquinoline quinone biosynthesis peptide chaperone PqqD [Spelaeicoccus albus]
MPTDQHIMTGRPSLGAHLRLQFDAVRGKYVLLGPETVSVVNGTAADILRLCNGRRSVAEIEAELIGQYREVPAGEVAEFVARQVRDGCLEISDG